MPDSSKPRNDKDEDIGTGNESLLREVRELYDFDTDAFASIREEGSEDIKFVANDPWSEKEKQLRRENDRPMLAIDQLNQYTNQVINEIRQHPREIKVSPAGYGATSKLAELRENRIRAIQYKSDAQAAYVTAMENVCQRSYGFARVSLRYVSETSFTQEIVIKRIPNPDAVLFDTGCKELDCSDAEHCFVLDEMPTKEFRRQWPDADIHDFTGDIAREYSKWIRNNAIQLAEYWRAEKTKDELIRWDGGKAGPLTDLLSKLKKQGVRVEQSMVIFPRIERHPEIRATLLNSRDTKTKKMVQYITNGVEILEKHEWLGKWIPIVPIFGKELYVTEAGGSKRLLMSLIRNARDAQRGYNYAKTCQLEAVSMVPKTNYLAIEGQFEGHEEEVAEAGKVPKPFLYYKAFMPDSGMPAGQPLPPPTREPFDPPIQNLEILSDSFRQAIQTAVGMYNSSVGKYDSNAQSGKAIQELDQQSDLGSFHFLDNYNRFICAIGRIVNDLQSKIEVDPMQVSVRTKDGKDSQVWINKPYTDEAGQDQHHDMTLGEYDVTINVGPNADSQREEASDFLDTFLKVLPTMGLDPAIVKALTALCIQIKQMGPIADKMVDILQPQPGDPAQMQSQLQQLQQQLQQLQQENATLLQDRAGRVLEQQTKIQLEQMKQQGAGAKDAAAHAHAMTIEQMQILAKIVVAELQSKSRSTDQIAEQDAQTIENAMGAAHEVGMQAVDHAHEKDMASLTHQNSLEQASQQGAIQAQASQQDQLASPQTPGNGS